MYLDYFGLNKKPFLITPDPAFLYPSRGHQQALAHLQYGLHREGGFLLLTGEVGTGKTTLCRLLMDNLAEDFRLAYLLNTKLESHGLLSGICRELGIQLEDDQDVNKLVEKIYDNLLEAHAEGKHTLVVIEEAQNLSPDVLETLRLLTNLETSATKLLHILLIGQPELLATLRQAGLRQLNQRVVSRSHLGPLDKGDLPAYFRHRLKMAGTERPLFTRGALTLIYRKTGGIPRLVNLLAEHSLMGAYATGKSQVTRGIVGTAGKEIFSTLQQPEGNRRWWLTAIPALIILGGISLFTVYGPGLTSFPDPVVESPAFVEPITGPLPAVIVPPREAASAMETPTPDVVVSMPGANQFEVPQPKESSLSVDHLQAERVLPEVELKSLAPGAYRQLLAHWNLAGDVSSEHHLCELAQKNGLKCARQTVYREEDILAIKRPVVVKLFNRRDGLEIYFVDRVSSDSVILRNSSGERRTLLSDLLSRMHPDVVFLWQPPKGYAVPLNPGESNPLLVEGVQRRLTAGGYLAEYLVTGGVYSEYLVARVKAFQADHGLDVDGILGEQTLLELSRYDHNNADQLTEAEN